MAGLSSGTKIWCKYCGSQHTFVDYSIHRLSTPHLKKLKKELLEYGFSATCRVCKFDLKGLNHVQSHVEDKSHSSLVSSISSNCIYALEKYGCDTCGIMFFNELALEAHKLMPPHGSISSSSSAICACLHKFPKLVNVIRQIHASAIPMDGLSQEICSFCVPCNVSHNGLEEFLTHVSEQEHAFGLRASMCIICEKKFEASGDRETHLESTKHRSNLQNVPNRLQRVTEVMGLKKGGYTCMYCMLWCSTWQCLEQHLMGKHHGRVYSEKRIMHARLNLYQFNARDRDCPCDASTAIRWKAWLQKEVKHEADPMDSHAWCHTCGSVLPSLYSAHKHLEVHQLRKAEGGISNSHALKLSSLQKNIFMSPSLERFECSVCAISFKNEIMLMVHEASFEHHRQLGDISSTSYHCCADCGVLIDQNNDQSDDRLLATPNEHLIDTYTCDSALTTHHKHGVDSCTFESSLATNHKHAVDSCTLGSSLPTNCKNAVSSCATLKTNKCTTLVPNHFQEGGRGTDSSSVLFSHSRQHCESNYADNVKLESVIAKGCRQGYTGNVNASPSDLHSEREFIPETPHGGVAKFNRLPTHVSPSVSNCCFSHKAQEAEASNRNKGNVPDGLSTSQYPSVPIVAAAVMAPMTSIQQSIESLMAVVTQTLSAALPTSMLQTHSGKRPREEDLSEKPHVSKKTHTEYLGEALHNGLKSVSSGIILESRNKEGGHVENDKSESASIIGNLDIEPMTIFAVAASILPRSLQSDSTMQERKSEYDQGIHGTQQSMHVNMGNSQGFTETKREKLDSVAVLSKTENSNELLTVKEEQGIIPPLLATRAALVECSDGYDLLGQLATHGRWHSWSDSDDLSD